jgi:hypothetical protein
MSYKEATDSQCHFMIQILGGCILGPCFSPELKKIINKPSPNINCNFNCCSVEVSLRASAEEKIVFTETRSNDLLVIRLIKLHPDQLSYKGYITWPYRLPNMGF